MPNWVYNSISITGDVKKLKQIKDLLGKPYKGLENREINFLNLIAPPDEAWSAYANPDEQMLSQEAKQANPYNWYDWNCQNWDTKWNACETNAELFEDSQQLVLHFSTAWSPPVPVVEALAQACINLNLEMNYRWEEEQGFGEEWELDGDEWTLMGKWDMPTNHAEHDALGKECPCELYEEKIFDDCPRPAPTETTNTSQVMGV
jgi:hypothetical protein